jgi:hypothetical protein
MGDTDARGEHYAAQALLYATQVIATVEAGMGHHAQMAGVDQDRAREALLASMSVRRSMLELLVPEVDILRGLIDEVDEIDGGGVNSPELPEPDESLEREIAEVARQVPPPERPRPGLRTLLNGSLETPRPMSPPSVFDDETDPGLVKVLEREQWHDPPPPSPPQIRF